MKIIHATRALLVAALLALQVIAVKPTFTLQRPPEVWRAGQHLPEILKQVERWGSQPRPTNVLDMFAGESNLFKQSLHRGLSASAYDVVLDKHMNILTRSGWYLALWYLMQVVVHGLVVWGPPCNMWLRWMSASQHQRAKVGPLGAWQQDKETFLANVIHENTCVLMAIAVYRQLNQVLEQPGGSHWIQYPSYDYLGGIMGFLKSFTWMRGFDWFRNPKPTMLEGTMPGMSLLKRVYSKKREDQRSRTIKSQLMQKFGSVKMAFKIVTAKRFYFARKPKPVVKKIGRWITGTDEMKKSGAYSVRFVNAILDTWQKTGSTLGPCVGKDLSFPALRDVLLSMPFPMCCESDPFGKQVQLKLSFERASDAAEPSASSSSAPSSVTSASVATPVLTSAPAEKPLSEASKRSSTTSHCRPLQREVACIFVGPMLSWPLMY